MPYIRRQNPEEEQAQAPAPQARPAGPAGASVAAGGGAGGAQAPRPQTQSRFVNLGNYLNQNRGAAQQAVTRQVGNAEQQALGAVKQFQGVGQNLSNQAANAGQLSSYQPTNAASSSYESEYAAPGGPAVNQYKDVKYKGPESIQEIQGYGAAQNSIAKANANIKQLGGGNFKNPYDSFLAGQVGGQQYQGLKGKYQYLNDWVSKGDIEAKKSIDSAKAGLQEQINQKGRDADAINAKNAQNAAAAKAAQDKINATNNANQANNHAGYGDLQNTTASQSDRLLAQQNGLENEWMAAGSPPWDQFMASRKGQ
jgi:hypothetical protein